MRKYLSKVQRMLTQRSSFKISITEQKISRPLKEMDPEMY